MPPGLKFSSVKPGVLKKKHHATFESRARVVDDQYSFAVGANVGSMHAPSPPTQLPWVESKIVTSSSMVGSRQSQWPANPPACEPSASETVQLPTPVSPPLSIRRKLVNAGPSGTPPLAQVKASLPATHHV